MSDACAPLPPASRPSLPVPGAVLRFLVVGGSASLLNWLVRFPLSAVLPFDVAVAAAYSVGMVLGFALYRVWVFPGSTLSLPAQILRFVAVNAAGFAVVVAASRIFVEALAWSGVLSSGPAQASAHAAAIALGAAVNFAGHRAVTFARRAGPTPAT